KFRCSQPKICHRPSDGLGTTLVTHSVCRRAIGWSERRRLSLAAAATTLILTAPSSWADEEYWAAVMRELPEASVSLDQALKRSEQEGNPISAEYDVEDGDLQISVYVEKSGHFTEVIVDPKSGTINTTKPLTVPREVEEAQVQ